MTPDEIVLLARKADLWITSDERWAAVVRFARLVEAAEREACAKIVEADGLARGDEGLVLIKAAGRIRARGEK